MSRLWFKRGAVGHRAGYIPNGMPPYRIGAPTNFWNQKLADNHPTVTDSNNWATKFANQTQYTTTSTPVSGPADPPYQIYFNKNSFSVPIYVMPAGYPTRQVTFKQGSTVELNTWVNSLPTYTTHVPVPQMADLDAAWHTAWGNQLCAGGSDQEIAIWQPSTDTMWEFWKWRGDESGGYFANYGGVVQNVSTNDGTLPFNWGARATSIVAANGIITNQDWYDGIIAHGLNVSMMVTTGDYMAPATRSDGAPRTQGASSSVDAVPEGLRLRFPANLTANPTWQPFTQMVFNAIRDYGLTVVDAGGGVIFQVEDSRAVGTPFCNTPVNRAVPAGGLSDIYNIPWHSLVQIAYP